MLIDRGFRWVGGCQEPNQASLSLTFDVVVPEEMKLEDGPKTRCTVGQFQLIALGFASARTGSN